MASLKTVDIAALGRQCVPKPHSRRFDAIVASRIRRQSDAMQIDFPKTLLKRWHLPEPEPSRSNASPRIAQEALAWLRYFQTY